MLNFRGALVGEGRTVTVDTRFDGGRHLRIARGIAVARVFSCGAPVWWKVWNDEHEPTSKMVNNAFDRPREEDGVVIVCDVSIFSPNTWDHLSNMASDTDSNLVVFGCDAPQWWADVHFRTGLRVELAEEIRELDEPVGVTAGRYSISKEQVRQCREDQDPPRR